MQKDISIVISAYNRLWCLPHAVESCRSTTCNVEIVVVDDGSTDGTWEWLQQQPDVVAVRTDNWGKDWAVEAGLAVATGDYVRILDSDDWLKPQANADQLKMAREPGADMVVAGYEDFYAEENETSPHPWVDCDDFIAQQLGEVSFSHFTAFLFRRSLIKGIPHRQDAVPLDDRLFLLEVALRHPRIAVYREPAFVHRHHDRGRMQAKNRFRRDIGYLTNILVYKRVVALLEQRGELNDRRKRAVIKYLWPLVRTLAKREPDDAVEAAAWIFQLDPSFVPPERGIIVKGYGWLGFRTTERLVRLWHGLTRPFDDG